MPVLQLYRCALCRSPSVETLSFLQQVSRYSQSHRSRGLFLSTTHRDQVNKAGPPQLPRNFHYASKRLYSQEMLLPSSLKLVLHVNRGQSDRRSVVRSLPNVQSGPHRRYSQSRRPELVLSSDRVQFDQKVEISLRGLHKGQKVTLFTHFTVAGVNFGACGHYVADGDGGVSTYLHPSHGGTFTGVESMGLFWSCQSEPSKPGRRFFKADVTCPINTTVAALDGFIDPQDLPWGGDFSQLAHRTLQRHYMRPGVRRLPVAENGVRGTLFFPRGKGPYPTVIDMYGLVAHQQEHRACLLASHGFATFSLVYLGAEGLPADPMDIDFTYFLRVFDWLSIHPEVDPDLMGCLASCFGGGYALLLAAKRPKVRCLANINGLAYPLGRQQVVEGEQVMATRIREERLVSIQGDSSYINMFQAQDNVTVPPAWRHGAKLLFLNAEADQAISPKHVEQVKEVIPNEVKDNVTFISYPGAGHLLDVPFGPHCPSSYNKVFGRRFLWGGLRKHHIDAQEQCWPKIIQFFKDNLRIQQDR